MGQATRRTGRSKKSHQRRSIWAGVLGGIVVLIYALAWFGMATAGADGSVIVAPDDSPVVIRAWVGDDRSFSTSFQLVEKSGTDTDVKYLPSNFAGADGASISQADVTVVGPSTLPGGSFSPILVSVATDADVGTYSGNIRVVAGQQHVFDALVVPVSVVVRAKPNLIGFSANHVRVVRCKASCFLAPLVPGTPLTGSDGGYAIVLENKTGDTVKVRNASVLVKDDAGKALDDSQIKAPDGSFSLADTSKVEVQLSLHPNNIPPGHYSGQLELRVEGLDEPVVIPLDVTVEANPLLALMFLIVGIYLGRLAKNKAQGTKVRPTGGTKATKLLARTAGLPDETKNRIRAFAAWLATLVLVLAIGFYNTYAKTGATFGANWISDVFGLLAFGLSAEVAGATLSSLPKLSGVETAEVVATP